MTSPTPTTTKAPRVRRIPCKGTGKRSFSMRCNTCGRAWPKLKPHLARPLPTHYLPQPSPTS